MPRLCRNSGEYVQTLGSVPLNLKFDDLILEHKFTVIPGNIGIETDGIIGLNFLLKFNGKIDFSQNTFSIKVNKYDQLIHVYFCINNFCI